MVYSEEQMIEMTMEIDAIVDLMKAVEAILEEEKKGTNIVPIGNVVYVDLFILPEFQRLRNAKLHFPQVLAVYHDWAERTYNLAMRNRGRLKKGKLRKLVESCLAQVQTIQVLFQQTPPPQPTHFG